MLDAPRREELQVRGPSALGRPRKGPIGLAAVVEEPLLDPALDGHRNRATGDARPRVVPAPNNNDDHPDSLTCDNGYYNLLTTRLRQLFASLEVLGYVAVVRPLIVFTGQGLAKADGFDLTDRLQREPGLNDCFGVHGREPHVDLDEVFSACGRAGNERFDRLIRTTRLMCMAERATARTRSTHVGLFRLLAEIAQERPVLHLTTNIDGLTTEVAVGQLGAMWRPLVERCTIDRIVFDVRTTLEAGRGFLHIPVHGEAGLLAAGDGATTLWTARTLADRSSGASTLYMGLGRGVVEIERAMIASQLGYRLLAGLLTQREVQLDHGQRLGPYPVADLVVIGYGARGSAPRRDYPFEKNIVGAAKARTPLSQATRTAVIFTEAEDDVVSWYTENGFKIVRHGPTDLVAQVRRHLDR